MPDAPESPGSPSSPPPAAGKPPAPPAKPKIDPIEEKLRREVPSPALDLLRQTFPDVVSEAIFYAGEVTAVVPAARIVELLRFLRDEPRTRFDLLADLTAGDYPAREKRFEVVYHLYSIPNNRRLRLKTRVAEGEPVPSATAVYNA